MKPPPTPPKGGECLTGASLEKLTFIQRGRSVALKGASLHIEERLSLHERNALFICTPAIPANELLPRNTPTDAPSYANKAQRYSKDFFNPNIILTFVLICERMGYVQSINH